nr:MAG TPA: Keratinocyte-associated protein [Caudoviricetes sp.]
MAILKKLTGLFHHNKRKIFAVQLFPYLQSV